VVDGRKTNLALARAILCRQAQSGLRCLVLDTNALYSSNSDYIFAPLSERQARTIEILVPDPGSDLESDIASLIASESGKTIVVDSLNSVYHLLASHGEGHEGRKAAFVLACLSYLAHVEMRTVIVTMYQRGSATHSGGGGRVSDLSDQRFLVEVRDDSLKLKCDRGYSATPSTLSIPIP
jgi:hypothetical protein